MNEIFSVLVDLPVSVRGSVQPDENGDYTVFINSRYNYDQCKDIFNHEVRHLLLGHHQQQDRPIQEIEQ